MVRSTMQNYALSIPAILRHGSGVHGHRRVLTLQPDGQTREATYAEVGRRSARLAHGLASLGVGSGDRVGTFMWNNQEHVEAYMAAPSMGAVLHTINLRLSPEQAAWVANHAEDRVIVLDGTLVSIFAKLVERLTTVRTLVVTGDADVSALKGRGLDVVRYDDLLAGQPDEYAWPEIDELEAAALCYTSGTTGDPKGVAYSHRSTYLHSMAAMTKDGLQIGNDDMILAIVPQFHANAWGSIYAAFMAGAELLLPDRFLQAEPLVKVIDREKPTMALAVPTIWNDVLEFLERNPGYDVSSLGFVAVGGSAVPRHLMEGFERYGVNIVQAWGMTETSPMAAVARPSADLTGEDRWAIRVTQGRPVSGVEARIVDDAGNLLPKDGVSVGELQVRGPWIAGGYFGTDDPSKFQDGWLRTGDVGRMDEHSYITLTDRAKDVIKSGGEWISSVELEGLIASHPDVMDASVIGVPDPKWQERPLAVVVVRDGCEVTPQQLRDYLSDKVAKWWLPERWTFVTELPRTSVGKYDKKMMRALYADGELDVNALG